MRLNAREKKSVDDIGFTPPLPGRYHVMVVGVDASLSKFPKSIAIEFEVLAGTTPGQAGRKHTEFMSTAEAAQDRLLRLALATGILSPGEERDVVFQEAVGRQIIIELESHEYQGKTTRRVPFAGFWPIGHKDQSDVPLDQEALKGHKAGRTVAAAAGEPVTQAPAAAASGATKASGAGSWDDL